MSREKRKKVTATEAADTLVNEAQESTAEELELRAGSEDEVATVDTSKSAPADREAEGPYDVSEVPVMRPYVDLGGIKVAPREGLQLRLEVDERANRVAAVSLDYEDSVLQVQAFSAPKSSGLWGEVRTELVQQMTAQGMAASEEEGPLGPEVLVETPQPAEQGGGTRLVRFIAVDGPRWMLRGVIMGKAADDAVARERVIDLFRELVVVRGDSPMPPSELIPLRVPAGVKTDAPGEGQEA